MSRYKKASSFGAHYLSYFGGMTYIQGAQKKSFSIAIQSGFFSSFPTVSHK